MGKTAETKSTGDSEEESGTENARVATGRAEQRHYEVSATTFFLAQVTKLTSAIGTPTVLRLLGVWERSRSRPARRAFSQTKGSRGSRIKGDDKGPRRVDGGREGGARQEAQSVDRVRDLVSSSDATLGSKHDATELISSDLLHLSASVSAHHFKSLSASLQQKLKARLNAEYARSSTTQREKAEGVDKVLTTRKRVQ